MATTLNRDSAKMLHHGTWRIADGAEFPYRVWAETKTPRAVMIAVHGLSGAAQDFDPLGEFLAARGWAFYAAELRTQGHDPVLARRGDLKDSAVWLQDQREFIDFARHHHANCPWFFAGESMGAVIAWHTAARLPVEKLPHGLLLFAPVIALEQRLNWWQDALFRFFETVTPQFRLSFADFAPRDRGPSRITRDDAYQEWVLQAPHRVSHFTLRFIRALFELIQSSAAVPGLPQLPLLVLYAKNDVFIPPHLVEEFFERLAQRDKEKIFYPESYHLLLRDWDRDQVLRDVERWLNARLLG